MKCEQQNRGRSHDWIDQRSLALDRAIAQKLINTPELLQCAKDTLERWIRQRQPAVPKVMLEWQEVLDRPLEQILKFLTSSEPEPTRLRQSSPFCGILTREERREIFQEYESLRTRAHHPSHKWNHKPEGNRSRWQPGDFGSLSA